MKGVIIFDVGHDEDVSDDIKGSELKGDEKDKVDECGEIEERSILSQLRSILFVNFN